MNTLVVLNAGLSTPSTTRMIAERIANAVEAQVTRRGESVELQFVDIRDFAQDLATMMTTGISSEKLKAVQDQITAADGLVATTPVFAASYSGLFKMFMDALDPDAINDMPVIIAATAGTPRHSLVLEYAMRPLFAYLRAKVVPTSVFAATDDFDSAEDLDSRIERAANQLADEIVSVSGTVGGLGPSFSDANLAKPKSAPSASGSGSALASGQRSNSRPKRSSGTSATDGFRDFQDLLRGHDGN